MGGREGGREGGRGRGGVSEGGGGREGGREGGGGGGGGGREGGILFNLPRSIIIIMHCQYAKQRCKWYVAGHHCIRFHIGIGRHEQVYGGT